MNSPAVSKARMNPIFSALLVKRLKGRTSRLLQAEFPNLKKRYWGNHFWAIGYGAWSTGNITDEMVKQYLEHHWSPSNKDNNPFTLE